MEKDTETTKTEKKVETVETKIPVPAAVPEKVEITEKETTTKTEKAPE